MSEKLPKATHQGILKIGDIELPCFVLENGKRVLSGRGITSSIGMKGRGQGVTRITTQKALKPYISNKLEVAIKNPLKFVGVGSRISNPTSGYEATILQELCEAILIARDNDALKTEQEKRYSIYAEVLIRAFAKVGIIALVDEATGYQEDRDREDLHRILEAYVREEFLPWTKRFPDEFYEHLFRLMGWQYRPPEIKKRPGYIGTLTNELIYDKLPPGVLDELRRITPKSEAGHRTKRYHQFLTEDIGNPHLMSQIASVITLMRISPNMRKFKEHFNRAFNPQREFLFEEIMEDEE